jgi:hypothetical protein
MTLQLNFSKPDNYAFFCPVSKVHLTRSNPIATTDRLTPNIKKALRSKSILDITEKTDSNAGQKAEETKKVKEEPIPVKEEATEDKKVADEVKEDTKKEDTKEPKKRGRKSSSDK